MGCRAGRADPEIASRPGELSGGKGAVEVGPIPLTYPQTQPVGSRTPGAHVLTCAHSTHRQADRTCMCSPSVQAPLSLRRPQEQGCQSCLEAEAQRSQNVRRREATPGELDLDWGCWLHLTCAVTRCGFRQPTPAPGSAHAQTPGFTPPAARPPEASLPWQAAPHGAWPGFWRLREAGVVWPCTHPPWLERGRCGERHSAPTWWPLKARAGHSCSCPAQPARSPW